MRGRFVGRDGDENAEAAVGERKADDAADESEDGAFEKEFAGDAAASGAERGAKREFLAAAFDADEQQVRYVGADDRA